MSSTVSYASWLDSGPEQKVYAGGWTLEKKTVNLRKMLSCWRRNTNHTFDTAASALASGSADCIITMDVSPFIDPADEAFAKILWLCLYLMSWIVLCSFEIGPPHAKLLVGNFSQTDPHYQPLCLLVLNGCQCCPDAGPLLVTGDQPSYSPNAWSNFDTWNSTGSSDSCACVNPEQ